MPLKTILVSAINHSPAYDVQQLPPIDHQAMDIPKLRVGCTIQYDYSTGSSFTFTVCDRVNFGEDFTAEFSVPEADPSGVEFFWEEMIDGETLGRMVWSERPRGDFGKKWGWIGMFWLYDTVNQVIYERTGSGIALTKFKPPWPLRGRF